MCDEGLPPLPKGEREQGWTDLTPIPVSNWAAARRVSCQPEALLVLFDPVDHVEGWVNRFP